MEHAHDNDSKLAAEWRRLAEAYGVEIVEDPRLAQERHAKAMKAVEGFFGPGS